MFGAHKFRTITLKNLVEFLNWIKIGYISRRLCIAINFNLKYLLILKKFYYYNYICSFFKYYNRFIIFLTYNILTGEPSLNQFKQFSTAKKIFKIKYKDLTSLRIGNGFLFIYTKYGLKCHLELLKKKLGGILLFYIF